MQVKQIRAGIITLVKLHKMSFSMTNPNTVVVSKLFLLDRNENNNLGVAELETCVCGHVHK